MSELKEEIIVKEEEEIKIQKKKIRDETGQRMKEFEQQYETNVDSSLPFLVRLDGHGFSKFTRGFRKPYDERISNTMIETSFDLLEKFRPTTAYTHSDEITLIFPALTEEDKKNGTTLSFNGRIQKFATLLASYCSIRFNYHIQKQPSFPDDKPILREKMDGFQAYFDARIFNLPNNTEVLNNIFWRSKYDCQRNSVFLLAHENFPTKSLQNLSKNKLKEKLLNEKNIDWNDQPNWYKFGVIMKKSTVELEAIDRKTNQPVTCQRTVIVARSWDLQRVDRFEDLFVAKYWNSDPSFESIYQNSAVVLERKPNQINL